MPTINRGTFLYIDPLNERERDDYPPGWLDGIMGKCCGSIAVYDIRYEGNLYKDTVNLSSYRGEGEYGPANICWVRQLCPVLMEVAI